MTQFLAPILINAYNAGMGTLARLIIWFAAEFPTRKESSRIGEESDVCSGYDVFLFLSQEAKSQGIIEWYKEDSMTYTPKVYGHQDAVDENFNK